MRMWTSVACATTVVLSMTLEVTAQDAVNYEDTGEWMQELPGTNARADDGQAAPVDISAAASNTRRRRRHKKKKRQRNNVDDDDADYYYDRDDQYGAPKAPASSYDAPAPSYNAPAPSYSPPSYSPPSYSAPSDGYGAPAYDDGGGGGDGFNDFLNALAAFLPIGLFLAAIPPNIITINSNTGRKKRGINDVDFDDNEQGDAIEKYAFPFLSELQRMGYDKLEDPACQKQFFCKMAAFGDRKDANYVQKVFHYASTLFPAFLARPVGLDDVFGAVQNHHCDSFNCNKH